MPTSFSRSSPETQISRRNSYRSSHNVNLRPSREMSGGKFADVHTTSARTRFGAMCEFTHFDRARKTNSASRAWKPLENSLLCFVWPYISFSNSSRRTSHPFLGKVRALSRARSFVLQDSENANHFAGIIMNVLDWYKRFANKVRNKISTKSKKNCINELHIYLRRYFLSEKKFFTSFFKELEFFF